MIDVLDKSPITTYTVFVFNWPNGFVRARDGLIKGYGIVAGTTRTLGTYLGSFLTRLNKAIGIRFDHTHLIGHSLGAHVVGFAGKNLQQNLPSGVKLARITGLDPAGPCFQLVYPKDRIDAEDAQYVDIIHTNSGLLGALQQLGTRDVYLNGGSLQPGIYNNICNNKLFEIIMIYNSCLKVHLTILLTNFFNYLTHSTVVLFHPPNYLSFESIMLIRLRKLELSMLPFCCL